MENRNSLDLIFSPLTHVRCAEVDLGCGSVWCVCVCVCVLVNDELSPSFFSRPLIVFSEKCFSGVEAEW